MVLYCVQMFNDYHFAKSRLKSKKSTVKTQFEVEVDSFIVDYTALFMMLSKSKKKLIIYIIF